MFKSVLFPLLYAAEQPSLRLVRGTSKDGLHVKRSVTSRVKAMHAAAEGEKKSEKRGERKGGGCTNRVGGKATQANGQVSDEAAEGGAVNKKR